MTNLVDFIDALATSVYALAVAGYLRERHVVGGAVKLDLREGPYKGGTVLVVARPEQCLYVGQPAFVLVDSAGARWGRVLELQLNGVSTAVVDATTSATEVGINVSFKCPKGVDLFVLEGEDEVVWNPRPEPTAASPTQDLRTE